MLSDNVQYKILKLRSVMDPISDTKEMIPNGIYASRELLSMQEGSLNLTNLKLMIKLLRKISSRVKGITEITLNLDELNNSDNLEDGKPSNSLLTYHVTSNEEFK